MTRTSSIPDGADAGPPPPRRREWPVLLLFPLLSFLLLWDVLVGGRVLLPAEFLKGFVPWSSLFPPPPEGAGALPQWNVLQWDGMAEFYPWRLFAAGSMAGGHVPLWNPHVLSGTPFLANSQSAPLYPLHVLYSLPLGAGIAVRLGWLAFLHLSLAGLFAYLLARDLRVRPAAAAVGGAAYQLSGFAVAWLELPSFITVACWIPLLLLCLGRAVRSGSWRWAAAGGATAGLMLLGGHLQIAFYGLLAAGCTWLWETLVLLRGSTPDRKKGILVRSIGIGAAVVGLGFALAAPQMLPSVELSRMSHRAAPASEAGFADYVRLALPPQNWVTLLVPDYYGLPVRGDFWGFWSYLAPNVMEYAGHVGAAAWVLVLIALACGRRVDSRAWLLIGIGALSLLLAVGSPVARLLYFGLPGFSQSGSPARALVLLCLAQALLASVGLEWLLRRAEERWTDALRLLGLGLAGTLALMGGLHLLAQATQPLRDMEEAVRTVTLPALTRAAGFAVLGAFLPLLLAWLLRDNRPSSRSAGMAAAAAVAVAGELLLVGGTYNLTAPPSLAYPPTPLTDGLRSSGQRVATLNNEWDTYRQVRALLPPNASLAYGWRDAQGYDSLYLGHYRHLANVLAQGDASPLANGNIVYVKRVDSPLFPLLGARYVVSQAPLERSGLEPATGFPAGPPYVYEDQKALPEARLVSYWREAEDRGALQQLQDAAVNAGLENTAVVAPGKLLSGFEPHPTGVMYGPLAVTLERRGAGHLVTTAEPAVPSLLVLAEGYAPGWKARVIREGQPPKPVSVVRTNVAFMGVPLEPGRVTVEWRYEPASFRFGLFLALLGVMALIAMTLSASEDVPASGPSGLATGSRG